MKALKFYKELKESEPSTSSRESNPQFSASTGWLTGFIKRHSFHNLKIKGEVASADEEAARKYPEKLAKIIKDGGYCAHQIFNADETGLFWKKMPTRTYIAKSEKNASGFKAAKDRVTLLLCSNASGDRMLKPLLVNRSLKPRALKGKDLNTLPVHWMANKKAWVTTGIFTEWFNKCFVPEVENYMKEMGLEFKILLILDNAPGHPNLEHPNIKVVFFIPNTTSLIQPLDQGIISTFKKYYVKFTFQFIFDKLESDTIKVTEVWKQFNILNCVDHVALAIAEIKSQTLNACWKAAWPECVSKRNESNRTTIVTSDIISIAKEIGGEGFDDFGEHDIEELLVDEALNDDDILESMVDTTKDFETVDSELEDVTPLDEKLLREGLQLSAHKTILKKLEAFENKMIRKIMSPPWFVRNTILRNDLNIENINDYIIRQLFKFYEKSEKLENPTFKEATNYKCEKRKIRNLKPRHILHQLSQNDEKWKKRKSKPTLNIKQARKNLLKNNIPKDLKIRTQRHHYKWEELNDTTSCLNPLYRAVGSDRFNNVKLLINAGADLNLRYYEMLDTILMRALELESSIEMIQLLIKLSVNLNLKDEYGLTAFEYAYMYDRRDAMNALREAGADVNLNYFRNLVYAYKTMPIESLKIFLDNVDKVPLLKILMQIEFALNFKVAQKILFKYYILYHFPAAMPLEIDFDIQTSEIWKMCQKQVKKMHNHKLGKSHVTLYSYLLEQDPNRRAEFLFSDTTGILQDLKSRLNYPDYVEKIEKHVAEDIRRGKLQRQWNCVEMEGPLGRVTSTIRIHISRYLANENLEFA
ncbi:hypothetical protein LAZ67_19000269 [Cordylochernes scorpioides]|uniref:HTH CENPB-type domain-containing protein n=1 Tax=Cordylochernes scorpioides TaxID=51811 RepID=A0ABY6LH19_9ARAC|nr:hypothetical protein LAZ67_19000269 [Cordylochernes scorpioides]